MGLIDGLASTFFGNGRNIIVETAEMFAENAERSAKREGSAREAALASFAAEFVRQSRSPFDRFIDGLNRLPRPALALGSLGLMVAAMTDPIWFAERMQGIALVPEPLWWLMGAVVSFYFGARQQAKGQEFQRSIAESLLRTPQVIENTRALRALQAGASVPGDGAPVPEVGDTSLPASQAQAQAQAPKISTGPNPALAEWRGRAPAS